MAERRTASRWPVFLAAALGLGLLAVTPLASSDEGGEEEQPNLTNTVKWATASETENFGYNVYRGESEEGPFEQLNDDPIPGAGTTDETHRYEWVDDTNDPRKTYFYYVEAISMGGELTRFTPIIAAPPKLPPEEDEESRGSEADEQDEAG